MFNLRIISYDQSGRVTTNNAFPLRPDHWKADIDSMSGMLLGFTNEMKLQLKNEGFVVRKHDSGTVEYLLQESEDEQGT